jgi:hypothetical protein
MAEARHARARTVLREEWNRPSLDGTISYALHRDWLVEVAPSLKRKLARLKDRAPMH